MKPYTVIVRHIKDESEESKLLEFPFGEHPLPHIGWIVWIEERAYTVLEIHLGYDRQDISIMVG